MLKINKLFVPFILFAGILTSCNWQYDPDKETRDYTDYAEYTIKIEDMYQKGDNYFVYAYRPDCKDCVPLKGYILDYLDELKAGTKSKPLYLLEFHNINSDEGRLERAYFKTKPAEYKGKDAEIKTLTEEMVGAKVVEDTYFFGTPSLYDIQNNSLNWMYIESKQIKKVL